MRRDLHSALTDHVERFVLFFFSSRRRHTRLQGDWSSDVCSSDLYGGGILDNTDIQPRVPVMGHFGEKDAMIPAEGVKKLAAKHPKQQIFLYPADHGFNCDHRGSYHAPSAKQARERTLAFLRKHLG